jgi:hypothetical protein
MTDASDSTNRGSGSFRPPGQAGYRPGTARDLAEGEGIKEGRAMRNKLVLWFLLLLAGFVIGFILQYSRLQRVHQELSTSTKQLGSCQSSERLSQLRDTATMMYLEVVQKKTTGRPGSIRGRFLIKLSKLRVARRTPHSATCFVTPWQRAIRSPRTWRRGMPLPFRKYSWSYLNSNRPRSIDGCVGSYPAQACETRTTEVTRLPLNRFRQSQSAIWPFRVCL